MSFASGTFSINSAGQPVVTGTVISSTAFNALTADLATGLSTCILKDGTQTLTANIPMSVFKLTGLAAGSASGDSLRYEQVNGVVTTAGDILQATAAGVLARLGIGTAGQQLRVNAGATAVAWTDMSPITNSLSGDVALSNVALYFDGPSVAQGTAGTWLATGSVTCFDTGVAANFVCKLWDGTTVIASTQFTSSGANVPTTIALSGYIAAPAGNIRISVKDTSATTGLIKFNQSGNSKDSTISAIRIL